MPLSDGSMDENRYGVDKSDGRLTLQPVTRSKTSMIGAHTDQSMDNDLIYNGEYCRCHRTGTSFWVTLEALIDDTAVSQLWDPSLSCLASPLGAITQAAQVVTKE